ncbi:MAG: bifunctional glutamate N-acetyltransferase/amino-acid acetyltransferase ArgJ [bacterium]|nr:bifunctional glutamate N-acetyltransferase/amino-acid acetyltransferase ArgJ [bacterium]
MKKLEGGVTVAEGFMAGCTEANIKYKDRTDMALVFSKVPAKVAGTFTTNVVKAAPVKWGINIVKNNEEAQAVVINSGIANACTSKEGDEANEAMAAAAAESLKIPTNYVLTASTGVIGVQLPVDKITAGAKALGGKLDSSIQAGNAAAKAIMTTDTYPKEEAVEFEIGGKLVKLGGMSKGSGMIHPNMATMLSVITTDLAISKELLQDALSEIVKDTFNMISVDRDTSTNDTCVILANGLAGNVEITEKNEDFDTFVAALSYVATTLAKNMAKDGEGATKLIESTVIHAASKVEAKVLAKAVITSSLVKTAVYGSDANWGRIICALGYSGVEFNPEQVDLYIESKSGTVKLCENGVGTGFSEELATKILSDEEVTITSDMKSGTEQATAWGCDLTYDYVKINGDYRS